MLQPLLADGAVAGFAVADIVPIISSTGSLGFAIWYAYYTATKVIPDKEQRHQEAIDKLDARHSETIDDLLAEIKLMREDYGRWKNGTR